MIFGKTLRVFAATLVLTSSISFAQQPGGTGTNNPPNAPTTGAQPPSALIFPNVETTKTLEDGTVEDLSIGTDTETTKVGSEQLQDYVAKQNQAVVKAGGTANVLIINPDQPARDWLAKSLFYAPAKSVTIAEKELPKTWNDRANSILEQMRRDGKFSQRYADFKESYAKDRKTFFSTERNSEGKLIGKAYDPYNITVSIIRMTINSGLPYSITVITHGLHNIAPHVAFLPFLAAGVASGIVFTYFSTFIPWNRKLPMPGDNKFWEGVEILIKQIPYFASEVGFLGNYQLFQWLSNKWALHRNEIPQYKVMTFKENWAEVAPKSLVSQSPLDTAIGQTYEKDEKTQNDLEEAYPERKIEIEAQKTKLFRQLGVKGSIVSVLVNMAGLIDQKLMISKMVYGTLIIGGFATLAVTLFPDMVDAIRDYFTPESIKLPRIRREDMTLKEITVDCNSRLGSPGLRLSPSFE